MQFRFLWFIDYQCFNQIRLVSYLVVDGTSIFIAALSILYVQISIELFNCGNVADCIKANFYVLTNYCDNILIQKQH